ncbi:hypothetical protein, partial [Salmonella sp. s51228]|uniref:hypothetical protein n=1 Tax=Salmonella sp. s51228 TaxID=3159652 RepID=UPI003980A682
MEKAIQLASKATDADKAKNFSEAMVLYQSSVQYFLHSIKYDAHSEKTKITLRKKCEEYLTRAEELGKYTDKKKAVSEGGHTKKGGGGSNNNNDGSDDEDEETKRLKNSLQGALVIEKPNVKWEDVAGLNVAKEMLKEAV